MAISIDNVGDGDNLVNITLREKLNEIIEILRDLDERLEDVE
jgi:hypothetical protein